MTPGFHARSLPALLLFIMLGPTPSALAEPLGPQFVVDPTPEGHQSHPWVSGLADGGYVVVWSSGEDSQTPKSDIYGQRYDAAGRRVGEEFRANSEARGFQRRPVVAGLKGGGFVVAWDSSLHGYPGDGIFGRRYFASGKPAGDEFRINTHRPDAQLSPSIAGLGNGGFVVTWSSRRQDEGDRYGIFGQRFDAKGEFVGGEFGVNTYKRNYQTGSSVTGVKDGGFFVAWESLQAGDTGVYGQLYGSAGAQVGGEFPVVTAGSSPNALGLLGGGFIVTWVKDATLRGQRYDPGGQAVGAPFEAALVRRGYLDSSAGAALADGGFVLIWTVFIPDGITGVFGQRYDGDGSIVGDRFRINSKKVVSPYGVSVAGLKDGGFLAAWEASEGIGALDDDVFGRQYGAD